MKKSIIQKTLALKACLKKTVASKTSKLIGSAERSSGNSCNELEERSEYLTFKRFTEGIDDFLLRVDTETVGRLTGVGAFQFQGYLSEEVEFLQDIQLEVEGVILDRGLLTFTHKDNGRHYFELYLPACVWHVAKGDKRINFVIGSKTLLDKPFILSEKYLEEWLTDIMHCNEEFHVLRALEHIMALESLLHLPVNLCLYFSERASELGIVMNLEASDEISEKGLQDINVKPGLKQALLEVSDTVARQNVLTENIISQVAVRHKIAEEEVPHFIEGVIPVALRNAVNLSFLTNMHGGNSEDLTAKNNSWDLSLALVFAMDEGNFESIPEILNKLASQPKRAWVSTDCIRYCCQELMQKAVNSEIELQVVEKTCSALIRFIDSFEDDWFSIRFDQNLIHTVTDVLSGLDTLDVYVQKEFLNMTLRNYTLSPAFWSTLPNSVILKVGQFWPILKRANTLWIEIEESFLQDQPNFTCLVDLIDLHNQLWLHGTEQLIRERVMNSPSSQETGSKSYEKLLLFLKRSDSEEVRMLTYPNLMSGSNTSFNIYNQLRTLRQHLDRRDPIENAKFLANALLIRLSTIGLKSSSEEQGGDVLQKDIQTLRLLCSEQAHYLGVDLIFYLRTQLPELDPMLDALDAIVLDVLKDSKITGLYKQYAPLQSLEQHELTQNGNSDDSHKSVLALKKDSLEALADKNSRTSYVSDTLVVIYSCEKYLGDRVQAIRDTWVKDLQSRGIPYLVLTGGGNDTVDEDVLSLDVPDNYESLPLKSLKLFEWVYKNTDYQYVLKIDDDCYLDVDEYFDSMDYRQHHYYGRILKKEKDTFNRIWHQEKSSSLVAKNALDKSSTPSVYADGGAAYSLSRYALKALNDSKRSTKGRNLIACSYMEDKLVGDLLADKNICVNDTNYHSFQRRRTFSDALPVSMYENIFYPSQSTPTKVVHLDTSKDQKSVWAQNKEKTLMPKKIWPTYGYISIEYNANQLELLTELKHTSSLLTNDLMVVAVMRNEMVILEHFLQHYRALGFQTFIIVDNCSDDGTREFLMEQSDVVLYSTDAEYKHSHYGVSWQQAVLGNHCLNKWTLIADTDEFLIYSDCENSKIADYLTNLDGGVDCVRVNMIDMYPYKEMSKADFTKYKPFEVANYFDENALRFLSLVNGKFSNTKNCVSNLRHRLDSGVDLKSFTSQKFALIKYKPWMQFSQGFHDAANINLAPNSMCFAHFKYHAAFENKVKEEIKRKQHYDGAKEYHRYLSLLAESQGNFGSQEYSKCYKGSNSFKNFY